MPAAPRTLLTAVGLAAVVGCGPTSSRPRAPGDEWLKAIRIEGNQQVSDDVLVAGLALRRAQRRGRAPDPYLVTVDADRIRGAYLRRGYLDVDVRSSVVRDGDAITVVYIVEEGVRARTSVIVTGLPEDIPIAEVRARLPIADGAPFDYAAYDAAKDGLKQVVQDAGYAHVQLDASVVADPASSTAFVRLDYVPGPKTTFGRIEIIGVEGRLLDAVRARLQIAPGQRYSMTALLATQRSLYALNRFSTVGVQPSKGESAVVDVEVHVVPGARHELKLGGGFGLEPAGYEVRGRAGYAVAGWPFALDTVTLDLRPAFAQVRDASGYEPRIRALARLERQDLFWTYSRGELEGGYNYIAYEAYTSYGPRVRLGASTPLGSDRLQVRLGWELERLDFRNIHPLIDETLQRQLGLDGTERDGVYEQAVIVDLRDHPLETRAGAYIELRAIEGTKLAGGAFDYVQLLPELRGFVPVGHVVVAARARLGSTFGDVAPSARLFSGGASRHRGFSERKLAPSAFGLVEDQLRSIPYGGGALIETGVEARVRVMSIKDMPLGAVAFLDGGDVTENRGELALGDLHWAAGLGLRLHTIVGPVRADVGYRLGRTGPMEPEPGSSYAVHVSLGEAF